MMVVAVHFSGTITLGVVLLSGCLAAVGLIRFAVRAFQGAKQEANAELAESNAKLAEERADQLRKFLDEALAREQRVEKRLETATAELIRAKDQIAEQSADLERMRALPNTAEMLKSFHGGFQSMESFIAAQLAHHEQRAQERQSKLLTVLDLMAARLGPDPNGASA